MTEYSYGHLIIFLSMIYHSSACFSSVFFPGASSSSVSTYTKDKARPPFPVGPNWVQKTQCFDVSEEHLGQEGDESSTSSSAEDGWKLIELQGKSEGKAADSLFLTLSIVIIIVVVVVFVNRFIAQSNSSCRFANPIAKAGQDQRKDPAPAALKDGLWIVLKKHESLQTFWKKICWLPFWYIVTLSTEQDTKK